MLNFLVILLPPWAFRCHGWFQADGEMLHVITCKCIPWSAVTHASAMQFNNLSIRCYATCWYWSEVTEVNKDMQTDALYDLITKLAPALCGKMGEGFRHISCWGSYIMLDCAMKPGDWTTHGGNPVAGKDVMSVAPRAGILLWMQYTCNQTKQTTTSVPNLSQRFVPTAISNASDENFADKPIDPHT